MRRVITKNGGTLTIQGQHNQSYQVQITGNSNTILIGDSKFVMNICGNGNTISIIHAIINIDVRGNGNTIQAIESRLKVKVYGNGNTIREDTPVQPLQVYHCNGYGNQYPKNTVYKNNTAHNQQSNRSNISAFYPSFADHFNPQNSKNQKKIQKQPNMHKSKSLHYQPMQQQIPFPCLNSYSTTPRSQINSPSSPANQTNSYNPFNPYIKYPQHEASQPFIPQYNQSNVLNQQYQPNMFNFKQQFNRNKPNNKQAQINNVFGTGNAKNMGKKAQKKVQKTFSEQPLTPNEFARIPRNTHQGKQQECSICFLQIFHNDEETFLFCAHSYHTFCIQSWFQKSPKCPICNENVRKAF